MRGIEWASRKGRVLAGLLLLLTLVGCGRMQRETEGAKKGDTDGRLKVVTTIFPYYDFVRQIAGERVELTLVVPAGMDSHSFEPTPADMRKIQEADVLICNGGAMEHWLEQVLDAIDGSKIRVITLMDYVDTVEEELVEGMEDADEGEHHHESHDFHQEEEKAAGNEAEDRKKNRGSRELLAEIDDDGHHIEIEYDEHIWTSPVNARKLVTVIRDVLIQEDPLHEAEYQEAAGEYKKALEKIDEELEQVSARRKRNLIVVGDKFPFRYLAEEYGLDYRAAFSGCSTDTEPSARTIAYLIDKIREKQIPVVYYLELSSTRVAEIISEETGAKPLLLHSCHNVTRREFEAGITYVELMEQNVENLRKGLDE